MRASSPKHKGHTQRLARLLNNVAKKFNIKLPNKSLLEININSKQLISMPADFILSLLPTAVQRLGELPIGPSKSELSISIEAASKIVTLNWRRISRRPSPWVPAQQKLEARLVFTMSQQLGFISPFASHSALSQWLSQSLDSSQPCFQNKIISLKDYEYYPFLGHLYPQGKCHSMDNSLKDYNKYIIYPFISHPLPHYANSKFAIYSLLSGASVESTQDENYLIILSNSIAYICIKEKINKRLNVPLQLQDVVPASADMVLPKINFKDSIYYTKLFRSAILVTSAPNYKFLKTVNKCTPGLVTNISFIPLRKNESTRTIYYLIDYPEEELLERESPAENPYALILSYLAGCLSSRSLSILSKNYYVLRQLDDRLNNVSLRDLIFGIEEHIKPKLKELNNNLNINDNCDEEIIRTAAKQWSPILKKLGLNLSSPPVVEIIKMQLNIYKRSICGDECRHPYLDLVANMLKSIILEDKKDRFSGEYRENLAKVRGAIRAASILAYRAKLLYDNIVNNINN